MLNWDVDHPASGYRRGLPLRGGKSVSGGTSNAKARGAVEGDAPRAGPEALRCCSLACLNCFFVSTRRERFFDRLDCKVRYVFFYFVIPGGQHQVSSKSLRIKTKHDVNSRLALDSDMLTYPRSLGE
jgi:hypothetical protein